ncbi:hypothetical protein F5984_26045 [Rudanella paleaurantiibacter]|uniref:Uncharacterized protein n=1 Tax=Rudanella paleaurantiibacter TaxID=2614655 RepID=A0A7J5TRR5_9BACT|nr:hypothetical protein [Rudanella paleaurantiibacter]KAB7725504.1 hypothetical protein F5984_26045 [Rudanella paleaurantiibacter]
MNRKTSPNVEQAKKMFLVFSEALSNDPDFASEFLEEEGYDLNVIDKQGQDLFRKIELANQMSTASIKKQSFFERAKSYAIELLNSSKSNEVDSFESQNQAIRLALHRDFKGVLSQHEIDDILCNQTILTIIKNKFDDTSKPE